MLKKLISLNIFVAILGTAGCNAGSSANPTISASVTSSTGGDKSTCPTLTETGSTCTISVVYNTNKVSGVSLGYNSTPTPLPTNITNGTFNTTYGNCQSGVGTSSGDTTCPITITYSLSSGSGTNSTIAFTLGNAKSNTIVIKGN